MMPRSMTVVLLIVAVLGVSCSGPGPGSQRPGSPTVPADSAPQASAEVRSSAPSNAAETPLPAGVLASIAVQHGDAPGGLAIGFGSIWVESHRGTYLYRIPRLQFPQHANPAPTPEERPARVLRRLSYDPGQLRQCRFHGLLG